MPLVAPVARCVAPDLIGFGQSGKPDIDYSFFDQARYLDACLEAAGITSAYLVLQDWGTGLGFHLAARRPDFVKGIAFMEFLRPFKDWEDFSETLAVRASLMTTNQPQQPGEGQMNRPQLPEKDMTRPLPRQCEPTVPPDSQQGKPRAARMAGDAAQ